MRCPTCGTAGPALHESFPRFTPVPVAAAPHLLWVIILRSSGAGLSRHRVALPSRVLFDGETGQPRALKEKEVPPSNAVVYALGAVMLFHSRKERGDPEPEFEGDSGGRYSICVNLGAQGGFYWIKRDDGESQPVAGARRRGVHIVIPRFMMRGSFRGESAWRRGLVLYIYLAYTLTQTRPAFRA